MHLHDCLMVTNSAPKELVSTLPCFFENQYVGIFIINMIKPVLDHLFTWSPAWYESTKALIPTPSPSGWTYLQVWPPSQFHMGLNSNYGTRRLLCLYMAPLDQTPWHHYGYFLTMQTYDRVGLNDLLMVQSSWKS